jgi:hypothetical protein
MSYSIAIMSEFVDSNKLPCRVDEEVSLIQYAGTNKILREREVAMKVTCRKCGWNREGLTQGSILAVNGDD